MRKYVYLIKGEQDNYKIGISLDPKKRLKQLQTGNSEKLKLVESILCDNFQQVEIGMHNGFSFFNKIGEWFILTEEDVKDFSVKCKQIDDNLNTIKKLKI